MKTELTKQQIEAAHSTAPVTLVPSSAGSGKTRTLVERVMWLLDEGATPDELCIVTFTQAAALELKQRIDPQNIVGLKFAHIGTLHSLLLKLLRRHGHLISLPTEITVMSEEEADAALLGIATGLKVKASMKVLKEGVAPLLSKDVPECFNPTKAGVVCQEFVRQMKQTGELSFDALLVLGHRLIVAHPEVAPCRHLLLDEAQDSAVTDWRVYEAIKSETKFIVGDRFQRIYSFRAASDGFDRHLDNPDSTILPISTNFRSSIEVIKAANRLFPEGHGQDWSQVAPEGSVTLRRYGSAAEEIASVAMQIQALPADSTVAVLFRTNKAADLFRTGLLPFGLASEAPRPEANGDDEKLAVAMLRAMCAPHNDRAVLRMVEACTDKATATAMKEYAAKNMQSIGAVMQLSDVSESAITEPKDVEQIMAGGLPRKGLQTVLATNEMIAAIRWLAHLATQLPLPCTLGDLLLLATQPEQERPRGRIHVGTVHSAKGLEWNVVFLPCFEDEVWPGRKTGEDEAEEKRLAYVAVTRARLDCRMSWCAQRPNDYAAWKTEKRTPSRFAVQAMGGEA